MLVGYDDEMIVRLTRWSMSWPVKCFEYNSFVFFYTEE